MSEIWFTKTHEWIAKSGAGWKMGITDYAQSQLGDITFVEVPDAGTHYSAGETIGSIESVKAVSEYYAPVDIDVISGNEALEDSPELVNEDPLGRGYLLEVKVLDPSQLSSLMDEATYNEWEKGE
ncbi:MAG: glycine cleavage system protein GcvH [bacterium]|jgi:glycine cleavage system H protein